MNILFAMPWDQRTGGVTHVAASLAAFLRERGHSVTFLFPSEKVFLLKRGQSLRGFPSIECRLRGLAADQRSLRGKVTGSIAFVMTLVRLLVFCRQNNIDLINVHYPGAGFACLATLARLAKIPLVVSAHGSDLLADSGPNRDRGLLLQLRRASAVVVPSRSYMSDVAGAFVEVREKIHCIYNGIDAKEVSDSRAACIERPKDAVAVVCIAALIPKKGVDVLIKAASLCRHSVQLRLIGTGPMQERLERLSQELGVADRVVFLGARSRGEVFQEISSSDFIVLPSRHRSESFGLAILEAMACGKSVIASAVGGLPEVVTDGETGLLVEPDNPTALAGAMDLLATDRSLAARLGQAGEEKAKQMTTRQTGEAYEALFDGLVNAKNSERTARSLRRNVSLR